MSIREGEKDSDMNIAGSELNTHTDASVADGQLELLQRLADRAVRDAEELAAGIKKEAESEAARLTEDAGKQAQELIGRAQKQAEAEAEQKSSVMLQQAKQRAIAIEAEAINKATQTKMQAKEDIEKYLDHEVMQAKEDIERHLANIAGKFRAELRSSVDYLLEMEETLGEVQPAMTDNEARSESSLAPISTDGAHEIIDELPSTLNRAIEEVAVSEYDHPSRDQNADAEIGVQEKSSRITKEAEAEAEKLRKDARKRAREIISKAQSEAEKDTEVATESAPPQEYFDGKVEIEMAPPINIARLIGITRHLESTPGIRILQTAGSWSNGSMITLSLDEPLPLADILRDIPNVEEVKILREDEPSSSKLAAKSLFASHSGQGEFKRISIVLGGSWVRQAKSSAMLEGNVAEAKHP